MVLLHAAFSSAADHHLPVMAVRGGAARRVARVHIDASRLTASEHAHF